MPDRVTVTTRKGFPSRLSESTKSVVFGLVVFVVAFPLLFWNEGRAVRTSRSLDEGAGVVASVAADRVDPANQGRLVHVSGFTETEDVLRDETFAVSENAIKLVREVEMYQWIEKQTSKTDTNLGGSQDRTTTFEYVQEWRADRVDSSDFQNPAGHENPRAWPYESRSVSASQVNLGAFELSNPQLHMLRRTEALPIANVPPLPGKPRLVHDGTLYIGGLPTSPAVGDVRVRFHVVRPGPVSVVARQVRSTFEPYSADAGGDVFLLEEGIASADAMFESSHSANTMLTWVVRGLGFFMMFLGLALVLNPIAVLGDVVPIVGAMLGAGVGVLSALVAALFSLVTIGVAWITYRPLLGLFLLALGAATMILILKRGQSAQPHPPPPPIPVN